MPAPRQLPTPDQIAEARRIHREQGRQLRALERAHGIGAAEKHRATMAERSRAMSKQVAEIGPPPPRDEERWERYRFDLFRYLCDCFPHSTGLTPLSLDHKRIAERLQQIFLEGGRELIIMYRGSSKSTILENAVTWCAGYGHREFVVPLAASLDMAKQCLESVQYEFETNVDLLAIFPAACHAAAALEGIPQRARKQTINGEPTYIVWTGKRCVLPTVPGFEGSGCIVWPRSITAKSIRGMRFKRPDGKNARPDFIAGDDLQTDETAANPKACAKILKTLTKTVARLGGHRSQLAMAIAATIIETDDAIDQLQDPKKYPTWRTTKVPMLKSRARNEDTTWLAKYADIRSAYNPEDVDDRNRAWREATEYYAAHRTEFDAGAEASWESCFDPEHEISAIQHAYNILIDDGEEAFLAECQSDPLKDSGALEMLTSDQVTRKQWAFPPGAFPKEATVLTAHVDVHRGILYAEVWAYQPNFSGGRVDEIFFPDQRRRYFAHRNIRVRLKHLFPGLDEEATVIAGVDAFLHGWQDPAGKRSYVGLMRQEWKREDGVPMRVRCALVDANGEYRNAIIGVLSRSPFAANLHPSFGVGITAKKAPVSAWPDVRAQQGVGPEWGFTKPKVGEIVGIKFDANYWKSRFHRGLALPKESQGSLCLPRCNPADLKMTADHYTSEKGMEVTADKRTVTEFAQKPNTDNHKLDNAVGCMVAASRCGITNMKAKASKQRKKKKGRTWYG